MRGLCQLERRSLPLTSLKALSVMFRVCKSTKCFAFDFLDMGTYIIVVCREEIMISNGYFALTQKFLFIDGNLAFLSSKRILQNGHFAWQVL